MNSADFLNISVGVGFLVLVGFISYVCIRLTQTLESLKTLTDDAQNITSDVRLLKDKFELGLAKFVNAALNTGTLFLTKKGGGKKRGKH